MASYVSFNLTARGDKDALAKMKADILGEDPDSNECIDFEKIIPDYEECAYADTDWKKGFEGFSETENGSHAYFFQTRWNVPDEILDTLAENYPRIDFEYEIEFEGKHPNFFFIRKYKCGKELKREIPEGLDEQNYGSPVLNIHWLENLQDGSNKDEWEAELIRTIRYNVEQFDTDKVNIFNIFPDEWKTESLCCKVLKLKSDEDVDEDDADEDDSMTSFELWLSHGAKYYEFCLVHDSLKTPEIYIQIVKKNGKALEHVPEELKTAELCLAAVQQNGKALKYVPKALQAKVEAALKKGKK